MKVLSGHPSENCIAPRLIFSQENFSTQTFSFRKKGEIYGFINKYRVLEKLDSQPKLVLNMDTSQ